MLQFTGYPRSRPVLSQVVLGLSLLQQSNVVSTYKDYDTSYKQWGSCVCDVPTFMVITNQGLPILLSQILHCRRVRVLPITLFVRAVLGMNGVHHMSIPMRMRVTFWLRSYPLERREERLYDAYFTISSVCDEWLTHYVALGTCESHLGHIYILCLCMYIGWISYASEPSPCHESKLKAMTAQLPTWEECFKWQYTCTVPGSIVELPEFLLGTSFGDRNFPLVVFCTLSRNL